MRFGPSLARYPWRRPEPLGKAKGALTKFKYTELPVLFGQCAAFAVGTAHHLVMFK